MVNTGKSSLLSAIAGQTGLFPHAECPGTTNSIQIETEGSLRLVDTPGIDAVGNTYEVPLDQALTADTLLFCHSLRIGEFRPSELLTLKEYLARGGAPWKVSCVLTNADNVPGQEYIQVVADRIAEQLYNSFRLRFSLNSLNSSVEHTIRCRPFNLVGINVFRRAFEAEGLRRCALLRHSGIPGLRRFLTGLADRRENIKPSGNMSRRKKAELE